MANIPYIIAVGRIESLEDMKFSGATHLLDIESLKTADDIQKARSDIEAISGSPMYRIIDTTNSDVTLAASLLNLGVAGKIVGPFVCSIDNDRINRPPQAPRCQVIRGLYLDAHQTGSFGHKFWENIPKWLESGQLKPTARCKVIPGGLNAELVNERLNEMGNLDDGSFWQSSIVHPWDESPKIEIEYMRDVLKASPT